MSLEDCLRLAQSAQSAASIARQQAEIARYGIAQARAGFFPQAGFNAGFNYNSPPPRNKQEFAFVAANGNREYLGIGTIATELDTSGRLRAQMGRARADLDVANANMVVSQRDLKRAVTTAYYRLLLARHLVMVTRASLEESMGFETRTGLLFQGGEAARADVVKAEAETQFLRQAMNASELEARLANHDLASFWTAEVEPEVALVDTLDLPPPAPDSAAAELKPYLARMEFRTFEAQKRGFVADARRARAELYPQLSFELQYGIDSNRVAWGDRGYAAIVNLKIPIFDWFKARSIQRQFELQAKQVETQRTVSERTFSREYRDALARVEFLYKQLAVTEAQVKASDENHKLAKVRYEGGEGSALDVVSAQAQVAQARSNFYTARANYLNARADLEVTRGK